MPLDVFVFSMTTLFRCQFFADVESCRYQIHFKIDHLQEAPHVVSDLSLEAAGSGGEIEQVLSPYVRLKALNVAQWTNTFPETHVLNPALSS